MKALGIVVAMILMFQQAGAVAIWNDGFESGDLSEWTSADGTWATSGGNTHSGSKRAQVAGPASAHALLLSQSTAGYEDVNVEYWFRVYDKLEESDRVFIEWTANGADWQELAVYTNIASSTEWQLASLDLPAGANNNALFEFRFRAELGSASDCLYFDDVVLSGTPVPEPAYGLVCILFSLAILTRRRFA